MRALFILLLLIPSIQIKAQGPYADHATGLQFGYARFGYNQVELGLNHYWSYVRDFQPSVAKFTELSHTFGPSVSLVGFFNKGSGLYAGPKLGFNYAFPNMLSGRICPAVEIFPKHGAYAGFDIGASIMGLFFYYGYYIVLLLWILCGHIPACPDRL